MSNKQILADDNLKRLLFKLSLPAMTGMFVMALYNVIDTIFIGRSVGALGIAGLSIVFPIQMIVMAVGQLLGIGGASVVSRRLGENNIEQAKKVLGTVYTSVIILSLLITLSALIFKTQLLQLFGASTAILPFAQDYYEIIIFSTILFVTGMTSNNLVRAEGHAKIAMISMLIGAGMNILLDPIFIFVLNMGIKGAAWATVISQFLSVIYVISFINGKDSILSIEIKNLKIKLSILKQVFAIGISSFMRNVAGSFVFILFNRALGVYGGDLAIAAYGIVQRFLRFLVLPTIGIAQGLQPIAGFNFGAREFDKVKTVAKLATLWATALTVLAFIISEAAPRQMMMIFTDSPELIDVGANAMRLIMLMVPVVGFNIVLTSLFQALGKVIPSLILSMSREIIFLIPAILIMPQFLGLNGIWLSMPISDLLSFILSLSFYYRLTRELNVSHANETVLRKAE